MRWESHKPHEWFEKTNKFVGFIFQKLFKILYRGVVAVVARQAHNLEVGGSNPPLATIGWLGNDDVKYLVVVES